MFVYKNLKRNIYACIASMIVFSAFIISEVYSSSASKDAKNSSDFAFVAFGDGRLPGYMPYKESQLDTINSLINAVWVYDFGQISYDAEYKFNKKTKKLESVKAYPKGMPEMYMNLVFGSDGWIEKFTKGPSDIQTLRKEGQSWVYKNVLAELRKYTMNPTTGPGFALH